MNEIENEYGIICDIGGKRKGNQDSAFFIKFDLISAPSAKNFRNFSQKGILAMVCDGVSASNHGELGSSFVIRHLSSKIMSHILGRNFIISEMKSIIEELIQETNRELLNKFKDEIEKGRVPKTTIVGLLIIGPFLWIFNMGDSRAFLIKDGEIGQISADHIGVSAHEITQAFGQEEINPEIKLMNWAFESTNQIEKPVFTKDFVAIVCSDGLTDKVTPSEIVKVICQSSENFADHLNLQTKVENLFELTLNREIDDNVSIIAINLADFFKSLSKIKIYQLLGNLNAKGDSHGK